MNELVIIGNGFDRAHGLRSGYYDFKVWLLQNLFNKDSVLYSEEISNPCHLYILPWADTQVLSKVQKRDPQQFLNQKRISIETYQNKNQVTYSNALSAILYTNCNFLNVLLSRIDDPSWLDIETVFYRRSDQIINQTRDRKKMEKELSILNNTMEFLKSTLKIYLKTISAGFKVKTDSEFYSTILKMFNGKLNASSSRLILNYNYTNLAKLYPTLPSNRTRILNIHGTISDENHKVVFGYGSIEGTLHDKILSEGIYEASKNLKYTQYSRLDSHSMFESFLGTNFRVKIIGHSCGESDSTTLSKIFTSEKLCEIEIYHYLKEGESYEFSEDYQTKVFNIYRHTKSNFKVLKFVPPTIDHVIPQYNLIKKAEE